MDSVGERIKKRRLELKLTQTQIKQLTGISSGNMSDYEHNKILPSATALIALSSALKCTTDWLLTGTSLISEKPNSLGLTNEEKEFLEYFRLLDNDDHAEILVLMKIKCERLKKAKLLNSIEPNKHFA